MPEVDPQFPMDLTPEEAAAGFALGTVSNRKTDGFSPGRDVHAVTRRCANGWLAVKTKLPLVGVRYAIWHDREGKAARQVELTVEAVLRKYG